MRKKYLILTIFLVAVAFILGFTADYWTSLLPKCRFLEITGFYCPGCGGTRAVISLLRGRIITAFKYNPGVVSLAFIIALALVEKITDKKILPRKTVFWVVFVVILLVYYLVRNFT